MFVFCAQVPATFAVGAVESVLIRRGVRSLSIRKGMTGAHNTHSPQMPTFCACGFSCCFVDGATFQASFDSDPHSPQLLYEYRLHAKHTAPLGLPFTRLLSDFDFVSAGYPRTETRDHPFGRFCAGVGCFLEAFFR